MDHGRGDVRFFDRLARLYDILMPAARPADLAAGLALAERDVERVVDVAGGTGRAARAVDAPTRVVADAAGGMARRARASGLAAVRADAGALPVRGGAADAVLVVDALHHLPDPPAALAEARRVLAPGGVLVIREFDPGTLRGRAVVAAERAVGFDSTFWRPRDLAAAVSEAGLEPSVVDRGFGYTVAGVNRTNQ